MMYTFEGISEEIIHLQDIYRWLDVTKYKVIKDDVKDEFTSDDFFRSLLASPTFSNSYMGAGSWDEGLHPLWKEDPENAHGPFLINRITPEHFIALDRINFEKLAAANLNNPYYDKPSEDLAIQINEILAGFSDSTSFYRLALEHRIEILHPKAHFPAFSNWLLGRQIHLMATFPNYRKIAGIFTVFWKILGKDHSQEDKLHHNWSYLFYEFIEFIIVDHQTEQLCILVFGFD